VGLVFLARTGAMVELITQPLYTWMLGLASYGMYTVLWSLVYMIEKFSDLAMTGALQRILPDESSEERRAAIIKGALLLGIMPGIMIAILVMWHAPVLAGLINVDESDAPVLVTAIRLFAWAIPLWAAVETGTSALRACKAFGPEIRLRLLWEQLIRLVLVIILWLAGLDTLAILLGHLLSLVLTMLLTLRALHRYVSLTLIWRAVIPAGMLRELLVSGMSVLPSNILGRLFSDLPVVFLNLVLPGAAGANAAGLYSIARKLASIPQMVGTVFSHVIAPIAAAAENRDPETLQTLYSFTLRVSVLLAVPTTMALILAADSLLVVFVTGASAAWSILVVLAFARGIEASVGPATTIQQVVSHRGLPVMNSCLGLFFSVAISAVAYPQAGAVGVAFGVACGQVLMAILSVWQLSHIDHLAFYDREMGRVIAIAVTCCLAMTGVDFLVDTLPLWMRGIVLLLMYFASLWSCISLALTIQDRRALGIPDRRLVPVD
jgi:O-antigen/teichoic acid export membrane protein